MGNSVIVGPGFGGDGLAANAEGAEPAITTKATSAATTPTQRLVREIEKAPQIRVRFFMCVAILQEQGVIHIENSRNRAELVTGVRHSRHHSRSITSFRAREPTTAQSWRLTGQQPSADRR